MRRLLFLLLTSVLSVAAHAQYKVGKVIFKGASADQQPALEQTVGLRTGQPVGQADIQAAAQHLSDTGAFDDVQIATDGTTAALNITFNLKPLPPSALLLPSFQNFFWFTPAELLAGIRQRVPLFGSTLPESGNLIDAVQAALEAMLRQRSIPATIDHDIAEPSAEQQARVVNFYVRKPSIVVEAVHLAGVAPPFANDIRAWATRVSGSPLNDGIVHRSTDTRLLTPYVNAGYITAHIADRRVTPVTTSADKITVNLSGTVVPGLLLHVGAVTWAGSPELSTSAFQTASFLKPGEPAALVNLEKTVDLVAAPYRKKGYADVLVHSGQTIDTAAGTASYTFTVEPGELYRIRSVKVLGLTPTQQAAYDHSFTMKPGDPFDPDYIQHFFGKSSPEETLKYNTASYRAERDPAAHLADVTITVIPSSSVVEVR